MSAREVPLPGSCVYAARHPDGTLLYRGEVSIAGTTWRTRRFDDPARAEAAVVALLALIGRRRRPRRVRR